MLNGRSAVLRQEPVFEHNHYQVSHKMFSLAEATLLGAIESRQN
jgi:hypothetical protein